MAGRRRENYHATEPRHTLHSYLLPQEFEKLKELCEIWDTSFSGAIKRLISEKELESKN